MCGVTIRVAWRDADPAACRAAARAPPAPPWCRNTRATSRCTGCSAAVSPRPPPRRPAPHTDGRSITKAIVRSRLDQRKLVFSIVRRGRPHPTKAKCVTHTYAHARTHTRARATLPHARATLPLHTHARTRHTAAAPLPPRCCLPAAAPLLRGAASAALLPRRRLCGAAAAPLPRRCCHGAATRRLFALEPACKGLSPAW